MPPIRADDHDPRRAQPFVPVRFTTPARPARRAVGGAGGLPRLRARTQPTIRYTPAADDDQPLPVCDYTTEDDAPCEEPAQEKRWSGAAVVTAAALGAIAGGVLVSAGLVWALGLLPGMRGLASPKSTSVVAAQKVTIIPSAQAAGRCRGGRQQGRALGGQRHHPAAGPIRSPVRSATARSATARASSSARTATSSRTTTSSTAPTGCWSRVGVEDKVATVVGVDTSTDLAVIKIEGTGYPAIDIGTSKSPARRAVRDGRR